MEKTKQGLKYSMTGLLSATLGMMGFFMLGFQHYLLRDIEEVGATSISFAGFGILLSMIAMGFLLVGIVNLRKDSDELGDDHKMNVQKSSRFLAFGIIFFILFILLLFVFGSRPVVRADTPQETINEIKILIFALQISSIISTVFICLAAVYQIYDVVSGLWRKILWSAAGTGIVSTLVGFGMFLSIYIGNDFMDVIGRFDTSHFLTKGFAFIAYGIFFVTYLTVYINLKRDGSEKEKDNKNPFQ